VGKTRLALEVAAALDADFPDGIHFVSFAALRDREHVPSAIAEALAVSAVAGGSVESRVINVARERRMLLVLDNLEHLLPVPFLTRLLTACRELTVVATSRVVLHLSGEHQYVVPPMDVPAETAQVAADVAGIESVALLVSRARQSHAEFALTDDNAADIAAICLRLDGLPLAIELAAARVKLLPPDALLARLKDPLTILTGGARDLPARQQSLRGAITWSYEVLDEACRRLLERLAVFAGGASLADAETVCGPADELGQEVLDGLVSLVEQSLVRVEGDGADRTGGEPRYSLLVPIREFALERLDARGDADSVRRRHAARFLELVETAAPHLTAPDRGRWLDRLDVELENVRAALEHLIATGDAEGAWRFVAAAWRFWQIRGHMVEEIARVDAALALPAPGADAELRLRAVSALGSLWWWMGDHDASAVAYREVLDARRAQGDDAGIAAALYDYGFPRQFADPAEAMAAFEEARDRFARLGDTGGEARAWWGIANAAWVGGHPERSGVAARRAAEHFRAAGLPFDLAWALFTIGTVAIKLQAFDEAHGSLVDALSLFAEVDDLSGAALTLNSLATAAWVQGDLERAARLSGAVARLERSTGFGLSPPNREVFGFDPDVLRRDPATAPAWAEGEAMDVATAIALAREPPRLAAGSGAP